MAVQDNFIHKLNKATGEIETIDITTGELVRQDSPITHSAYCPQLGEALCDLIREGKTIKEITSMRGMPSSPILYRWKNSIPDFALAIRAAREDRADSFHADAVKEYKDIVDGPTEPQRDALAKSRLVIEAGLKLAKLDNPKEYSEQKTEGHTNKTIIIVTGIQRPEETDTYADIVHGESRVVKVAEITEIGEDED